MSEKAPTLQVLVCDADDTLTHLLISELQRKRVVRSARMAHSLGRAETEVATGAFNVIFIDPLSLGLDEASQFIFRTRKTHPKVVFVLFIDLATAEAERGQFYAGPRRRFAHYYLLDKRTPAAAFSGEVDAVLGRCSDYLGAWYSRDELMALVPEALQTAETQPSTALHQITEKLDRVLEQFRIADPYQLHQPSGEKNSIFLSCRFAESDYINGLKTLLRDNGFKVVTGEAATTYISKAILERIRQCEFFLCLMTKNDEKADGTYTTSPWLLEEKGAALAYGKYIVLLVEEGVTDYGALQGDWQRHHFTAKSFLSAALNAVQQLRSISGATEQ